jgi:hypothetical protein
VFLLLWQRQLLARCLKVLNGVMIKRHLHLLCKKKSKKMLQLSAVDVWLTNKRPFAFFKYKMNVKMSDYPTKKTHK